jgi:hypothetical protein
VTQRGVGGQERSLAGDIAFRGSAAFRAAYAKSVFSRLEDENGEEELIKRLHGNVSLIELSAF